MTVLVYSQWRWSIWLVLTTLSFHFLQTVAHPVAGPSVDDPPALLRRIGNDTGGTSIMPSRSLIHYDVPNSDTSLVITLGIAIPNTADLDLFLQFVVNFVQNLLNRRGQDYPMTEDGDDPFRFSCRIRRNAQFTFEAQSSPNRHGARGLTWTRARDMARGLNDVLIVGHRNRLPRSIEIFDREGGDVLGSGTVRLEGDPQTIMANGAPVCKMNANAEWPPDTS